MNECPQCGGAIWDNRPRKQGGRMKANAPDFACKDKEGCGWKKWPPKNQRPASATSHGKAQWTWPRLSLVYRNSLLLAKKHVSEILPDAMPEQVVAAAATVFIAASRDGVVPLKRPAPRPELEPEPEPEPDDDVDDDLPF